MQKRCADKILFPMHWANTCCSHPLADGATFLGSPIHGEADGPRGTIRAARRKLRQELGIANEAVPEESFRLEEEEWPGTQLDQLVYHGHASDDDVDDIESQQPRGSAPERPTNMLQ